MIDLNRVSYPTVDVSRKSLAEMVLGTGSVSKRDAVEKAVLAEEVLIRGGVNPDAIIGFVPKL